MDTFPVAIVLRKYSVFRDRPESIVNRSEPEAVICAPALFRGVGDAAVRLRVAERADSACVAFPEINSHFVKIDRDQNSKHT